MFAPRPAIMEAAETVTSTKVCTRSDIRISGIEPRTQNTYLAGPRPLTWVIHDDCMFDIEFYRDCSPDVGRASSSLFIGQWQRTVGNCRHSFFVTGGRHNELRMESSQSRRSGRGRYSVVEVSQTQSGGYKPAWEECFAVRSFFIIGEHEDHEPSASGGRESGAIADRSCDAGAIVWFKVQWFIGRNVKKVVG